MSGPILTEANEQAFFVNWLTAKGYKFTAIPNSTYTKSWKQKTHNTRVGLRAGFPDMVVIAEGVFMAIEMKRTKGSTTSPEQKAWIKALEDAGIPVKICFGCAEAIEFVKSTIEGVAA